MGRVARYCCSDKWCNTIITPKFFQNFAKSVKMVILAAGQFCTITCSFTISITNQKKMPRDFGKALIFWWSTKFSYFMKKIHTLLKYSYFTEDFVLFQKIRTPHEQVPIIVWKTPIPFSKLLTTDWVSCRDY